MNLQGRELTVDLQGRDVALLQRELRDLGLTIPDDELGRQFFGEATVRAVSDFQRGHQLKPTGVVDEATAAAINAALRDLPRVVRGRVRRADGSVLAGASVRAFDKDLRSEEPLGEAPTDAQGRYQISYNAAQFQRAEKASADLRVSASMRSGRELASSPTMFNAPAVATVDLVVGGERVQEPSEYERYLEELTPLIQPVAPADLREDDAVQDLSFLSAETEIDLEHIQFLRLAHQLAPTTAVPPEAYYGLFRQDLPTRLRLLLAQHPRTLRRALIASLRENIIPASVRSQLDTILERLRELIVKQALEEPASEHRPTLGALLGATLPSAEKQQAFLTSYLRREGSTEDFWKTLRESAEFRDDVDNLQLTLQVGALTWGHVPLVREIERMKRAGSIRALRDLAEFDSTDWLKILDRRSDEGQIGFPPGMPGQDAAEKRRNYASALTRIIEDAFPTPVLANRIKREGGAGSADLVRFFANNPDFEFARMRLGTQLKERGEAAFAGIVDRAAVPDPAEEHGAAVQAHSEP